MTLFPDISVVRQETTVTNVGKSALTITHLSSAVVGGVATGGKLPWHHADKVRVHYCRQAWEGEGQWRSGALEELGLYPDSVHPVSTAIQLSSIGSFSTASYFPMLVLEDIETGKSWFVQIETAGNWHLEVGYRGEPASGSLFIQADAADERFGDWSKELQPGESFISAPVAFGCCAGGFEEAVAELTKYRRVALKPANAWEGECPVCFNDYMNCLWGIRLAIIRCRLSLPPRRLALRCT